MSINEECTLEQQLLGVFQVICEKLVFAAPATKHARESVLNHLIQAATSKCVEFNIVVNSEENSVPSLLFVSNLRGICEDLICLTHLTRLEKQNADKLILLKIRHDHIKGLRAQSRFLRANNPGQPILTSSSRPAEEEKELEIARKKMQYAWPRVYEIAEELGLEFTYEFIYFATSNFVHFNPSALLRTGWGGSEAGPFSFSIRNMDPYYRSFSSLYGAIMFIGFYAAFGTNFLSCSINQEADQLIEIIGNVPRWPEIITFEEMNKRYEFNPLIYAVIKGLSEQNEKSVKKGILREILNLKQD